jgi:hypothetical protein
MQTVIWISATLGTVNPAAGLSLLAGQLLLSYVVSGIAKLAGTAWRSGAAIRLILATASYGSPVVSRVRPSWGTPLSWSVIAFEVGSPALLLGGDIGLIIFVALAVGFHASVAILLGLNNFLWAFGACLPAVVWLGMNIPAS